MWWYEQRGHAAFPHWGSNGRGQRSSVINTIMSTSNELKSNLLHQPYTQRVCKMLTFYQQKLKFPKVELLAELFGFQKYSRYIDIFAPFKADTKIYSHHQLYRLTGDSLRFTSTDLRVRSSGFKVKCFFSNQSKPKYISAWWYMLSKLGHIFMSN